MAFVLHRIHVHAVVCWHPFTCASPGFLQSFFWFYGMWASAARVRCMCQSACLETDSCLLLEHAMLTYVKVIVFVSLTTPAY